MRLKDKVVVVAGAGVGIGRAISFLFSQEGAKVAVISCEKEVADETAAAIVQSGKEAVAIQSDLSQASEVKSALEKVVEVYGRIDVLDCNMGSFSLSSVEKMEEKTWDDMFNSNLKAAFLTAKEAIPHFKKNGSGSIILTSAVYGYSMNSASMAHYNASKAGVAALMKSLSLELAPYRIRVNCICPGIVSHDLYSKKGSHIQINPELLREGLPEDIAYAALYFAGKESSWVTGSALVVDGGLSVGVQAGA